MEQPDPLYKRLRTREVRALLREYSQAYSLLLDGFYSDLITLERVDEYSDVLWKRKCALQKEANGQKQHSGELLNLARLLLRQNQPPEEIQILTLEERAEDLRSKYTQWVAEVARMTPEERKAEEAVFDEIARDIQETLRRKRTVMQ